MIRILFLILFSSIAVAQSTKQLNQVIEALKTDKSLSHASWGISVKNISTQQTVLEHNANLSLIPASTQKLITTAVGLSTLGADYTYKTTIDFDGVFDSISGIINGNVYITGSGDPTLDSEYFKNKNDTTSILQAWAKKLSEKGIKKITGAIIADASAFEYELIPPNWIWGDIGNYYGAGASGLSFCDNAYTLSFKTGNNIGDSTTIMRTTPYVPNLKIKNYVTSAGSEDNAYIYGEPYSYNRYVIGTLPLNKKKFEIKGALPDAAFLCAYYFDKYLRSEKITITNEPTTVRESAVKNKKKTLFVHTSPPLEKIVYWTNMVSNNLFAEHIFKTIAFSKNRIGKNSTAVTEVLKTLQSIGTFKDDKNNTKLGIDTKGLNLSDGCGLARSNTVTASQLTDLLIAMTQDKKNYAAFYNSLPVAGKTGTMSGMCKGSVAENNVRAKSGSINRVRSYAGYATTKKGEQVSFAILFNNFDCTSSEMRAKIEKIIIAIAEME